MAREKVKSFYNKSSKGYDKERSDFYHSYMRKNNREIAISFIEEEDKVLEVGCGTGLVMEKVYKYCKEIKGIDISEGMVEEARKKGLDVVHGSATDLPYPDSYFDVVYSFKVLPHIKDIDKALDEIYRVLKPSGYAILEFYMKPSFKWINDMIMGLYKPRVFTRYYTYFKIWKMLRAKFDLKYRDFHRLVGFHSFMYNNKYLRKITLKLDDKLTDWILFASFSGLVTFTVRE